MKTLSELQIIAEEKYPSSTHTVATKGAISNASREAYIQGCLDTQEESGFDIEFYRNGLKEIIRAYEISSEASISGLKMRDMALQMLTTFKDKPV